MAANLYLHTADSSSVEGAFSDLLSDAGLRADHEGLLEPPPPPVITQALDGWIAISGVGAWLEDLPGAARQMSRACRVLAVSCEIFGNCFRLRLTRWNSGDEEGSTRSPDHGWSQDEDDLPEMPIYEDAELMAYRELRELEIPTALVLIGTRPFGAAADPHRLGACAKLSPAEGGVTREVVELDLPRFDSDEAPVFPHKTSNDFGEMLFEDRYVEGRPGDAAVDRLLEIEDRVLDRATRVCPKPAAPAEPGGAPPTGPLPPNPVVSLTVMYYGGPDQPRLDSMLRHRNRHTLPTEQKFRPPWWQFWRFFGRVR